MKIVELIKYVGAESCIDRLRVHWRQIVSEFHHFGPSFLSD